MKLVTLRTSLAGGYCLCPWCRPAECMNRRAAQKIDNGQKCLGHCGARPYIFCPVQQDATIAFLFSAVVLLYMFRVTISPIIRSTYAVYGNR